MSSYITYQPTKVLTQRGIVEYNDLLPGDYVYEYGTSKRLEVQKVITPDHHIHNSIYRVIFTDGRVRYFQENDMVFTGTSIVPIELVGRNPEIVNIKQHPLHYRHRGEKPLDPDAYLAGAFIMFGSYDDKYINLPAYMTGINDVFAHKHSVEYADEPLTNNRVHFRYIGTDKPITWKKFFDCNKNYITTKDMRIPIIPDIYSRATYKNRIQFVRGVFDAGYNKELFDDNTVGIVDKTDYRLIEFQRVLWSLGILSKVEFDPYIDPSNDNKYKLTIFGNEHGYPGFTYLLDSIEHLLDQDNKIIDYDNQFSVKVSSICRMNYYGYKKNLLLNKPNAIFLSDNFLPLVSM